ncbi:hypothetical protein ACG9VV_000870 [Vibrio alginolyticus]|uniref:hypothetical protein n=1 Tax=Vibrio alginolyticus TaxID=663 RepID=UPI003749B817
MSKHEFNSEEAKDAQLKSASARTQNANRRKELRELFKKTPLMTILEDNCLDVNLTNEQRLEIKIHFLKSVLAPLVIDEQKQNHRVIEMLLQNELDEMLKAEPSKSLKFQERKCLYMTQLELV